MSLLSSTVPPSVAYLRSLPSIRERCTKIFDLASSDDLTYLSYDRSKESTVIDYCATIISRDFDTNYSSILPHGRWRHFDVGPLPRITTLLSKWGSPPTPIPAIEAARRLVDLFIVSVLLDAGVGTKWKYEEKCTGLSFARSEGLAVASLDMFLEGRFSSNEEKREQVDAKGLLNLSQDTLAMDMQVHPEDNPMTGLEGRSNLLIRLGKAVQDDKYGIFKGGRPGNLVDYLASHPRSITGEDGKLRISVPTLWEALIYGLAPIWPDSRTSLEGVAMGDVWPSPTIEALVPFHKLSQWMCYSIMEPIEQTLGWIFVDGEHQTGLPEYRNGGLFVDLGVLTPKPALLEASTPALTKEEYEKGEKLPKLKPDHPAVVEWRAMTVILLDRTAEGIRNKLGLKKEDLNLKQVLEAATWKGGREIAAEKRGDSGGGPPIEIVSDGTVF